MSDFSDAVRQRKLVKPVSNGKAQRRITIANWNENKFMFLVNLENRIEYSNFGLQDAKSKHLPVADSTWTKKSLSPRRTLAEAITDAQNAFNHCLLEGFTALPPYEDFPLL
jgi:hypothetical protein